MSFAEAYDPFRALGEAWQMLRKAPLGLLIGGLLLLFTDDGGSVGFGNFSEDTNFEAWEVALIALVVGAVCAFGLALFLFNCWMRLGFASTLEKQFEGRPVDVGDLFQGRGSFMAMVLARLLKLLIFVVAALPAVAIVLLAGLADSKLDLNEVSLGIAAALALLAYVPVLIYVGIGICLVSEAVAIERMQPMEALSRSWSLARGQRMRLLLYGVVMWILTVSGLCLCCVGILGTFTWAETAKIESYLQLVRGPARAAQTVSAQAA